MTRRSLGWLDFLLVLVVLSFVARTASADERTNDSPPDEIAEVEAPPSPARSWYGYQTLIVDGASLLTTPVFVGLGGFVLGAPIVHLVHGRPVAAVGSLGLRALLPIGGAFVGQSMAGRCHDTHRQSAASGAERNVGDDLLGPCFMHGFTELAVGAAVGLSVAVAIDAAFLAYDDRAPPKPARSGTPRLTSIAPSIDPITRSASVGVGGTF